MSEAVMDRDAGTLLMELMMKTPETIEDPYPHYHALRAADPHYRMSVPGHGDGWVLTTYDDCRFAMKSPALDKSGVRPQLGKERGDERIRTLLFMDGPEHTRLRGLISSAFTPRRVQKLRPKLERQVAKLIDPMLAGLPPGGGVVDLVADFARPLPIAVIGELVGVPEADWAMLRELTKKASAAVDTIDIHNPEMLRDADKAMYDMEEYFAELLEERRRNPKDDLISGLSAVEIDGDRLSVRELVSVVVLLFSAGFHTMTDLISLGTRALCENPAELARLRADRSLLGSAVEEFLRYDSPIQITGRTFIADTHLTDGTPVPAGDQVVVVIGAANRDPARFPDPDRLDVGRYADGSVEPPLSFAWGAHHCLGVQLARLEGVLAFGALLDNFADFQLADDKRAFKTSGMFRGFDTLALNVVPSR
ncbi:cytochrome P450 [Nonomuraea sp. NPDC046802]|uniref:cytochrome P450 n=1 Tax=Nonomuraea sp. NPDC046802 TaxID=3154919 RepID=UPI0033D8F832